MADQIEQFTVGTSRQFIAAAPENRKTIRNVGGSTLYYGDSTVTGATGTGIASGSSLVFATPLYFVSAAASRVFVEGVDEEREREILSAKDCGAIGDGVTDDTAAIQLLLDRANRLGGGWVYVPIGTYLISTALTIGSNTTLELAPAATIKRNATIDNMLRNKGDGTTAAYGQASYITVRGGTWDANESEYASAATAIAFGHAQHVKVLDVAVKNVFSWHHIELNAVQHAVIRGCRFLDHDSAAAAQEMVQLDLAANVGVFPWFGPYDGTPCDDILVEGCVFRNGSRGIGSHTSSLGNPHTNVRVIGNHFKTFREEGIRAQEWARVLVADNTFEDVWKSVYVIADTNTNEGFVITGNVIDAQSRATSRGIHINGTDVANRRCRGVTVTGNTVRNCASHAIGIDFCQDYTVHGNVAKDNAGNGIWIFKSIKGSVVGNAAPANASTADIIIGTTSGAGTDTTDTIVMGNTCGRLYVADFNTRVIVSNNIADTWYDADADADDVEAFNNFIAGVWTA